MVSISLLSLTANVTTSFKLSHTIKQLDIQSRTSVDLKLAINDADAFTAGNYLTIKAGGYFTQTIPEGEISVAPTVYLQAASNVDVELAQWFTGVA